MIKRLLGLTLPFLISCAQVSAHYPKDVMEFISLADDCQHLAGEWDSDLSKARQREIEKQVDVVCKTAKNQQNALRIRYHNQKPILEVINEYDF